MKKKFNIYCVLLMAAVVVGVGIHTFHTASSFLLGVKAGIEASETGRQADMKERDGKCHARDTKQINQLMNLSGVELMPKTPMLLETEDSIVNQKTGEKMPLIIMQGMVAPQESRYSDQRRRILGSIGCFSFAFVIAFWVIFIKLIIAVNKGRIFEKTMERQLAWGGWLVFGIYVLNWLGTLVNDYFNTQEFAFEAYNQTILTMPDNALLYSAFGMLLVGQIFKIGRKMKEEQELTI